MLIQPEYKHAEITERIISAFYTVYNTLGYGFLEKVCVNALRLELRGLGLQAVQEVGSVFTTMVR